MKEQNRTIAVQTSHLSQNKALVMKQFLRWADPENKAVCRDEKLLRGNLLVTENSKNYKVLLAMGRRT